MYCFMDIITIIFVIYFYAVLIITPVNAEEVILGKIVEHSPGKWEQSGVTILQYELDFVGTLKRFKATFKNQKTLYFQVWHQNDFDGEFGNYTLKVEWQYTPVTGNGIEMVNLTDFGIEGYAVQPKDALGFFLPFDVDQALAYQHIPTGDGKLVVVGSEWFPSGQKPHVGEIHRMGTIGYPNLFSVQYFLFRDGSRQPTSSISTTTSTTAATVESTTPTPRTPPPTMSPSELSSSTQTASPEPRLYTTSEVTKISHSGSSQDPPTTPSPSTGDDRLLYIVIPTVASFVVIIVVIIVAAVCFKKLRKLNQRRPGTYLEKENEFYGERIPKIVYDIPEENTKADDTDVDYSEIPADSTEEPSHYVQIPEDHK